MRVNQWPPGFSDSNPPVALHPFVLPVAESDPLGHVSEGELVLIQLPPVLSLDALIPIAPVKPEPTPTATAAAATPAVSEDVDMSTPALGGPPGATPSILTSIPASAACKVAITSYFRLNTSVDERAVVVLMQILIRESGRQQLQLGDAIFDLSDGIPLTHVVQIAAVHVADGAMALLGQATQRLVVQCPIDSVPSKP